MVSSLSAPSRHSINLTVPIHLVVLVVVVEPFERLEEEAAVAPIAAAVPSSPILLRKRKSILVGLSEHTEEVCKTKIRQNHRPQFGHSEFIWIDFWPGASCFQSPTEAELRSNRTRRAPWKRHSWSASGRTDHRATEWTMICKHTISERLSTFRLQIHLGMCHRLRAQTSKRESLQVERTILPGQHPSSDPLRVPTPSSIPRLREEEIRAVAHLGLFSLARCLPRQLFRLLTDLTCANDHPFQQTCYLPSLNSPSRQWSLIWLHFILIPPYSHVITLTLIRVTLSPFRPIFWFCI